MSLINYVTHQYTNATQNISRKTPQTPHKTSPGEGLQSLITLFLVESYRCAMTTGGISPCRMKGQWVVILVFNQEVELLLQFVLT